MGTDEFLGKLNKLLGGIICHGLASRPRGSRNAHSRFMRLYEPVGFKALPMLIIISR